MHLQQLKGMQSSKRVLFVNKEYLLYQKCYIKE